MHIARWNWLVALLLTGCVQFAYAGQQLPSLYFGRIGFFCQSEVGLLALREVNRGLRTAEDYPKSYCFPLDLQGPSRIPVAVLDAEDYPYVWVCIQMKNQGVDPVKLRDFRCGSILAQWIVGEDGLPLSRALIRAIAHQATMGEVRRLPDWGGSGKADSTGGKR